MKTKNTILFFALSIALASCRTPRFVYSPAPPNNPYFREKGESKLAGYYSTGGDDNKLSNEYNDGLDLQGAYAITDHWAITGDYFKRNEKDAIYNYDRNYFDSSVIRYRRHLTNFGTGYFMPVTTDKKIMLNFFGGVGFGKFSFNDNGLDNNRINYSRYYSSNMSKWYIQPSINFFAGKYFRTGVISKICWVHYGKASTSYTAAELIYLDLDRLHQSTLGFVECTWNMQATAPGIEWMNIDGGFTLSSEPFDNNSNLEVRNFNVSIGLSIDFSKMKKMNK